MKHIFEQFSFIKPMLNTSSGKVQDSAFYGGVGTVIYYYISNGFNYMADNILGISLYMVIAFLAIMVVDYITGYKASLKEGDKPQSKKGLRWVVKLFAYLFAIYITNALIIDSRRLSIDYIPFVLEVFKYFVLFLIIRWEMKSLDENFKRLGYKFKIFGVFDMIADGFIGIFNKSIQDKTGIENIIKKEEEKEDESNN